MPSSAAQEQAIAWGLRQLAVRPPWLEAALQPEQVLQSLSRHVPEAASGTLRFIDCDAPRLLLKDTSGCWAGRYTVAVEGLPGAPRHTIPLRVMLIAPGLTPPGGFERPAPRPFGAADWSCYLPELRLHCEVVPEEQALEALPQLTDPEEARALLERGIASSTEAYRDLRIRACRPEVLNYKPGTRCTIRYHLEYAAPHTNRGWPTTVIAKTYRKRKGEQAFNGMVALWRSPLADHAAVRIAEPLAYLPELKVLIQTALPEEQTLEEVLRAALIADTPEAFDRLADFVRAAAAGLAALHRSGVRIDATTTWDEQIVEIPELLERLAVVAPDLADAIRPLFDRLQARAAAYPADPLVPSHGSFDSDQVLIAQERIGFIDFDSFCMAEPALDVGHFRAAIMDSGMKLIDERTLQSQEACRAYLERLDRLGAIFLAAYESLAPVSRQRLALWEALDYLRDALHLWTKPKLSGAEGVIRILEYHLRGMGLLAHSIAPSG